MTTTTTTKNPVRANLGRENSFHFDEKLGRWVDTSEPLESQLPPPPPPPPTISPQLMPGLPPMMNSGNVGNGVNIGNGVNGVNGAGVPPSMPAMTSSAGLKGRPKYIDPFNN